MAATAMTMRSNVANIGDMAFLDWDVFLVGIFYRTFHLYRKVFVLYLTCMNRESAFWIIRKLNKKEEAVNFLQSP
jgi:hypothetical protein